MMNHRDMVLFSNRPRSAAQCTRQVAMARSLLGMREYQRAARILGGDACTACPLALFLRSYATYLSGEKRRNEQGHEVQRAIGLGFPMTELLNM